MFTFLSLFVLLCKINELLPFLFASFLFSFAREKFNSCKAFMSHTTSLLLALSRRNFSTFFQLATHLFIWGKERKFLIQTEQQNITFHVECWLRETFALLVQHVKHIIAMWHFIWKIAFLSRFKLYYLVGSVETMERFLEHVFMLFLNNNNTFSYILPL